MNNCPKVSICIPTFNQTEFLSKTLDSILIQEYKNYEIIITDDSKTDIVQNLLMQYDFGEKLKYIKNKDQLGSPKNWNKSIHYATGDFIKIIHHDDWFADCTSLQKYVDLLMENPEIDFAFSDCYSVLGNKDTVWHIGTKDLYALKNNPYHLILGNFIGAPSVTIYRRRFNGSFDEALKWLVDLEFYIQILESNPKFAYSPVPLMNICSRGTHQVTNECQNDKDIELPEYIYLYDKYLSKIKLGMKHLIMLDSIYRKYNVKNADDLKSVKLISTIPASIKKTFSIRKRIQLVINKFFLAFFRILKSKMTKMLRHKDQYCKKSYSQCGEDLIVDFIFGCIHIEKPSFLDIGAHHPHRLSNTAFFYKKGCKGINIEPNPYLIKEFKKERKKDINLNIGISKDNGDLDFYIMSVSTMSTFSFEEAKRLENETSLKIIEQKKIPVKNIQVVLNEFNLGIFPDFLSLDVEGSEEEILGTIDFESNYPIVICLETLTYSESNEEKKESSVIDFLIHKGYFIYGDTYINTIFVRESAWKNR